MHEDKFKKVTEDLMSYCREELGYDDDPDVHYVRDDANAESVLAKTAHYQPHDRTVTVYISKRHPKDILRSLAHELVHHSQNCRGDLDNIQTPEGYAQNDPHMRNMEEEAYLKGNMMFRDWSDNYTTQQTESKLNLIGENKMTELKNVIKERVLKVLRESRLGPGKARVPGMLSVEIVPGSVVIERDGAFSAEFELGGEIQLMQGQLDPGTLELIQDMQSQQGWEKDVTADTGVARDDLKKANPFREGKRKVSIISESGASGEGQWTLHLKEETPLIVHKDLSFQLGDILTGKLDQESFDQLRGGDDFNPEETDIPAPVAPEPVDDIEEINMPSEVIDEIRNLDHNIERLMAQRDSLALEHGDQPRYEGLVSEGMISRAAAKLRGAAGAVKGAAVGAVTGQGIAKGAKAGARRGKIGEFVRQVVDRLQGVTKSFEVDASKLGLLDDDDVKNALNVLKQATEITTKALASAEEDMLQMNPRFANESGKHKQKSLYNKGYKDGSRGVQPDNLDLLDNPDYAAGHKDGSAEETESGEAQAAAGTLHENELTKIKRKQNSISKLNEQRLTNINNALMKKLLK